MMLHYWSNLQYYAEVLCENNTRPEMHCNGSCAIAKGTQAFDPKNSNTISILPSFGFNYENSEADR